MSFTKTFITPELV